MPTPTPGGQLADVAAMLADPLFSFVAHLAKSPSFGFDGLLSLADIVECDFPGYAPIPIRPTMDDAIDTPGYGEMDPFDVEWIAGAIVAPQDVTAIYVVKSYNGLNATLESIVFWPEPVSLTTPGQKIEMTINVAGLGFPDA